MPKYRKVINYGRKNLDMNQNQRGQRNEVGVVRLTVLEHSAERPHATFLTLSGTF